MIFTNDRFGDFVMFTHDGKSKKMFDKVPANEYSSISIYDIKQEMIRCAEKNRLEYNEEINWKTREKFRNSELELLEKK